MFISLFFVQSYGFPDIQLNPFYFSKVQFCVIYGSLTLGAACAGFYLSTGQWIKVVVR